MVRITVFRNSNRDFVKFQTNGHAGYADSGQDIVCSAVSVLVLNTINSIEVFTDVHFAAEVTEDTGEIRFSLKEVEEKSQLLMKSMALGLEAIQKEYGTKYIRVDYKEV
ncbi:MAG: ribosomal-processing cysteine protease Prp [Lachnospiraceae bacterium]